MLHPDLQNALKIIRKRRNFNVDNWINAKIKLLNEYLEKNGLSGTVVNLSGGIDSSVTIALCKKASLLPGSPLKRVVGIQQPIHSTPTVQNRATEVANALGIEVNIIDQTPLYDQLYPLVESQLKIDGNKFARGQLRSYMRTPVVFFAAQLLSASGTPSVVVGTGNKDEDGYLFYFCKAGDGVADIQLIADLHKSEVFLVGKALGVPESVITAPPTADLWDGQTDEDEIGTSYDFVELFTEIIALPENEKNQILSQFSPEGRAEYDKYGKTIEAIHNRNKHKEKYPLNLDIL